MFPTKLLLATNGSAEATRAARMAITLSERLDSELHIVYVEPLPDPFANPEYLTYHPEYRNEMRKIAEREAREKLAKEAEKVREMGEVAGAHARIGRPDAEITDLAEETDASLVVVGSRGVGAIERLTLGSVSEGIVHHATRPVLVARGGEEAWVPRRIIIGDDGSEAARDAGALAAGIGQLFGAKTLLVRAYPRLPEMDLPDRELDARMVDDELRHEERKLEERAADIEEALGSRPNVQIAVGEPAARILEAAQEGVARNTLITVGSRGLGTMQRMRLGSVSTKILRAAEGSVLIHPPSHEPGGGRV